MSRLFHLENQKMDKVFSRGKSCQFEGKSWRYHCPYLHISGMVLARTIWPNCFKLYRRYRPPTCIPLRFWRNGKKNHYWSGMLRCSKQNIWYMWAEWNNHHTFHKKNEAQAYVTHEVQVDHFISFENTGNSNLITSRLVLDLSDSVLEGPSPNI